MIIKIFKIIKNSRTIIEIYSTIHNKFIFFLIMFLQLIVTDKDSVF